MKRKFDFSWFMLGAIAFWTWLMWTQMQGQLHIVAKYNNMTHEQLWQKYDEKVSTRADEVLQLQLNNKAKPSGRFLPETIPATEFSDKDAEVLKKIQTFYARNQIPGKIITLVYLVVFAVLYILSSRAPRDIYDMRRQLSSVKSGGAAKSMLKRIFATQLPVYVYVVRTSWGTRVYEDSSSNLLMMALWYVFLPLLVIFLLVWLCFLVIPFSTMYNLYTNYLAPDKTRQKLQARLGTA